MSYLLVWHQNSNWCRQKIAVLHHYGNSCLVVLGGENTCCDVILRNSMTSQMEKPHTSSGHVTTKTIKAHSNYVLATSNLFNTRVNAPLPFHT